MTKSKLAPMSLAALAAGILAMGLPLAGFAKPAPPPSAASAPANQIAIDLFARRLTFNLPAGMTRVTDKANGANILIEYVPRGETVANWTRMVTIQAYRGLGKSPVATADIARQAFYPAACKTGPIYRDFGEADLGKGLRRTIVANGCASLPAGAYPKALRGAGEQDFIMIFRDAETVYTLNYAERGAPFAAKKPPRLVENAVNILTLQFGAVGLKPLN